MVDSIVFIDSEIDASDKRIYDLGAIREDNTQCHTSSMGEFSAFVRDASFLCGHNIVHHDLLYLKSWLDPCSSAKPIDTLYLSPLLFPKRPYHKLLKDDKLQSEDLNNPLNDAKKARRLFHDELNAFAALSDARKDIYSGLLYPFEEFRGFLDYIQYSPAPNSFQPRELAAVIQQEFAGKICENADLVSLIAERPVELAYALALVGCEDYHSITPHWTTKNYPVVVSVIKALSGTPCKEGCSYCREALGIHGKLKELFGFDQFRLFDGQPLQEQAVQAAVNGESLLAVFPTGGGKSITFQLPALMAGQTEHGLTVVISPLQSLMKDQVDNLNKYGLVDAVTVNGMLNPVERANALECVENGLATILYISPEQLRSRTIEKLLLGRNVVRFVIDEAHCFSAWGHDFRVDYLYIGDFIRELQAKKGLSSPIPVSCFTATAKQKVISDIQDYFKDKLGLDLQLFISPAARENLHYGVMHEEKKENKYSTLRSLIEQRDPKDCPTIVYVSRTKRAQELAARLTRDGFRALPYHGKMDPSGKKANQDEFINGNVNIIVATSAFGMGVDKKDVQLVVHYDISDSLENYVQEAGRAGRDPSLNANCYILFNEADLEQHFSLLNMSKLSMSEIQQIWRAIKSIARDGTPVCCSPLELARQAGWCNPHTDIETRVKTAVASLENAGYVKRGCNVPHVYATGIMASNMEEARRQIDSSRLLDDEQKLQSRRIISSLISSRSIAQAGNGDAESRVDYIADTLGVPTRDVISCVNLMRQDGLLADTNDMTAYLYKGDTKSRSMRTLNRFSRLEQFLLNQLDGQEQDFALKKLNEAALEAGISDSSVSNIRTIFNYWTVKEYVSKNEAGTSQHTAIMPRMAHSAMSERIEARTDLCRFILRRLHATCGDAAPDRKGCVLVEFSMVGLYKEYCHDAQETLFENQTTLSDMEDALLYLSRIGAVRLEGGFLVLYNKIEVERLVLDNRIQYKKADYKTLAEYYQQKVQQIHIVGEYANLMASDYDAAQQFVQDYFRADYKGFLAKYFGDTRATEITRNITPANYSRLFGGLSDTQSAVINDKESKYIVVAAGPGSGKTRVLVHKLASLLTLEDVKPEQLLMVTFSRASATEFKKRLIDLIGNAASFVEVKTFHSYCFDLLGKVGDLDKSKNVVQEAAALLESGEAEPNRIAKTVMVIDEAQDMDADAFRLVQALMQRNEDMRVIAVGDDDQNIYGFRGSSSGHMRALIDDFGAVQYEMVENYRSCRNIVALANAFVHSIGERMKTADIQAMRQEDGVVQITRHDNNCQHLEQPLVEQVIQTRGEGSTCVLTNTNEAALCVVNLLNRHHVRAKLIQSSDERFRLSNLAEIRYFLKIIDEQIGASSLISDAVWEEAKDRLQTMYKNSSCLENCLNLVADFEQVNGKEKYRSDLEEFIRTSKYEDFYSDDKKTVFVSTIHQSKGREFDSVYLLLDQVRPQSDADRRKLYVGMTRAKNNLYIHCNTDLFDTYHQVPGVQMQTSSITCSAPREVMLQLTYKDVILSFFKDKRNQTLGLRSGTALQMDGLYLTARQQGRPVRVAKLSEKGAGKLDVWRAKGYVPLAAEVGFVVAWKPKGEEQEFPVVLADLHLAR